MSDYTFPSDGRFGVIVAQLLERRGVSQSELAQQVGVTRAAMSRYISGDREPRMATILQIARCLGVSAGFLLGEESISVDGAIAVLARSKLTPAQQERLRQLAGE